MQVSISAQSVTFSFDGNPAEATSFLANLARDFLTRAMPTPTEPEPAPAEPVKVKRKRNWSPEQRAAAAERLAAARARKREGNADAPQFRDDVEHNA